MRRSTTLALECTPWGGQLRYSLLDSLPGELLLEIDGTAVAKGRVQPLGIVDLLDEARKGRCGVLEGLVFVQAHLLDLADFLTPESLTLR